MGIDHGNEIGKLLQILWAIIEESVEFDSSLT
jgi:hypothetical protein